MGAMSDQDHDTGTVTETRTQTRIKKPRMFRVLVHNDDYTTREFVVEILYGVFHLSEQDAIRVMLHVHNNGLGVAGVFTRDVAETKIRTVETLAQQHEFPLRLTMEPEEDEGDSN